MSNAPQPPRKDRRSNSSDAFYIPAPVIKKKPVTARDKFEEFLAFVRTPEGKKTFGIVLVLFVFICIMGYTNRDLYSWWFTPGTDAGSSVVSAPADSIRLGDERLAFWLCREKLLRLYPETVFPTLSDDKRPKFNVKRIGVDTTTAYTVWLPDLDSADAFDHTRGGICRFERESAHSERFFLTGYEMAPCIKSICQSKLLQK